MKSKLILGLLLLGGLPFLNSCKDDDDPEPPAAVVGTWERDVYQATELPAGFEGYEGEVFDVLYSGEQSYSLTITNDKKYNRKIERTGADINDVGTWTYEGTELRLDSDNEDFDDEEFDVEGEITANAMVLSQIITFTLLPDAVIDTLTTEWAQAHQEELDTYYQDVDIKLLFLFEK